MAEGGGDVNDMPAFACQINVLEEIWAQTSWVLNAILKSELLRVRNAVPCPAPTSTSCMRIRVLTPSRMPALLLLDLSPVYATLTFHYPGSQLLCCACSPYGHLRIKASPRLPRINRITKPILLPWCDHPAPLAAHSTDVVLLAVLAGQDMHSMAAKAAQLRAGGVGRQGGRSGCDKCIGQPGV